MGGETDGGGRAFGPTPWNFFSQTRLYEPVGILRALAPLLLLIRDTRSVDPWRWRIEKAYVNARAFLAARRLHAQHSMLQTVAAPEQSSQIADHRRAIA